MGQLSVFELIGKTKELIEGIKKWKHNNTIMLDIFMRRERHVYLKPLGVGDGRQSIREFGP